MSETIPEAKEVAITLSMRVSMSSYVQEDCETLISNACEQYHKRASAELQKQCEELRQANDNWRAVVKEDCENEQEVRNSCKPYVQEVEDDGYGVIPVQDVVQKAFESLKKERDELRTRAEKAGQWKKLATKLENALRCANNSFSGDSYGQKVIDEALEAFKKCPTEGDTEDWKARAEKAEAEVAEWLVLAKQYRYYEPGDVLTELRERSAEIDTLQLQLTTLQQDVRPLLQCLKTCIAGGSVYSYEALETFLAKHPELAQGK